MAVESDAQQRFPELIRLPQTGIYVGVSDAQTDAIDHVYRRCADPDGFVVYPCVDQEIEAT